MLGAIEAGGSKFVCGIGATPEDLITTQIPTTTPAETLEAVIEFFRREAGGKLKAVGIKTDADIRNSANAAGLRIVYVTDPWGTEVELTEGLAR